MLKIDWTNLCMLNDVYYNWEADLARISDRTKSDYRLISINKIFLL